MKFPGYGLAPDESGFSARFIGRSSVARRFMILLANSRSGLGERGKWRDTC